MLNRSKTKADWRHVFWQGLIVLFAACVLALPQIDRALADNFKTKAKHAVLMDANTGAVLFQYQANELIPPASMSKLMTLAIVFEALKSGSLKLTDTFPVSEHAWRTGGAPSGTSAMFAPLNKQVSVEDLIKGIAVQSGNDASIVIAEGMSGSEAKFAELLNKKAREIGLKKSTFGNPTGLPHPRQRMTALEIAELSRFLIKTYPEYYKYFGMRHFPYQPKGRRRPYAFYSRNPLLSLGIGADGLKTGYTKESGYGLVGSAVQDGRRLIVVVSGLKRKRGRTAEARKLLEWGFKNFTKHKLFDDGEIVGSARVLGGDRFYVPLTGSGEIYVVLPNLSNKPKLYAEIVYQSPLKPAIKKGDQVAILRVTSSTNAVNEVPLFAAEDVGQASIVRRGLDTLAILALRWISDQAYSLIGGTEEKG